MVLVRLLVLCLFHLCLAESQPTHSSQQAPGSSRSTGDSPQSPLGSDNLSFPWSRLRLPRYSTLHTPIFNTCKQGLEKEMCWSFCFFNPRYITPLHYHLLLHPNLTTLFFTGSVRIEIDVHNNTNWVVLHSKGLEISTATILDQNLAHLSHQVGLNKRAPAFQLSHSLWKQWLEIKLEMTECIPFVLYLIGSSGSS